MTGEDIIESIRGLPASWHANGSLNIAVIEYLARCAEGATDTAETGCGRSTLAFSHTSKRHLIFACDAPPGENPDSHSLYQVKKSSLLRAGICEFVIGSTQQTLPHFQFDREFDVVFLDGPHGYPFPELEYFYFYPHIRSGGWLVIDDIQIPTIANMVDVLKKDAMFSLDRVVRSTAFFRRTDAPTFPPFGDGWWDQGFNQRKGVALRHLGWKAMPRAMAHEALRRFGRR